MANDVLDQKVNEEVNKETPAPTAGQAPDNTASEKKENAGMTFGKKTWNWTKEHAPKIGKGLLVLVLTGVSYAIGKEVGERSASQGEVLGLPEGEAVPMMDYEDLTGVDVGSELE